MSTLQKRIETLEQTPEAQGAARIAHAQATGDLSGLSDDDLESFGRQHFGKLTHDPAWVQWVQGLGLSESDLQATLQGNLRTVSDAGLRLCLSEVQVKIEKKKQEIAGASAED